MVSHGVTSKLIASSIVFYLKVTGCKELMKNGEFFRDVCCRIVSTCGYRSLLLIGVRQEFCVRTVKRYPYALGCVPIQYKTLEMCHKAEEKDHETIEFAPDK